MLTIFVCLKEYLSLVRDWSSCIATCGTSHYNNSIVFGVLSEINQELEAWRQGAGMVQWLEHSSPTNAAASYVG